MARILSITAGIKSHLYSHLALANRLRPAGHELAVASHDASVAHDVESAGSRFLHLVPRRGKWQPAPYRPGLAGWTDAGRYARARREAVISGAGIPEAVDALDPDLIVVDSELHEHVLIGLGTGRPVATIEFHLSATRRPGVPRLSQFVVPDDTQASRLRTSLHWQKSRLQRAAGRLLRQLTNRGADKHSVLRELARRCGRDFDTLADTGQWQVYTFPTVPCLRATVPDMDFRPARPASLEYFIGPLILDAEDRNYDADTRREADRFLDTQPKENPLILLSFGSILESPERVRTAIDAVTDKPVSLLVSVGKGNGTLAADRLPPNVFIGRWLPLQALLPRARLMITHGGVGTIHECIDAGVPLLVYSMGVMDMHGNAARVHGKMLGVAGDPHEPASRMWQHIDMLLNDERYRVNCRAMAAEFARYGTPERALDAIERCMRTTDPRSGSG